MRTRHQRLYRHTGVALLRAAAATVRQAPDHWPDLTDADSCRRWLESVWSRPELAEAIRCASPTLANRLDALAASEPMAAKHIRRAATAAIRYILRATGRHTPFGLFAGTAEVSVGDSCRVRWGQEHRATARVDMQWLADVIDGLERCPDLLDRLEVVCTNLAVARGARLEAPQGPNRVTIRDTDAVRAIRDHAATPIRIAELLRRLTATFPHADPAGIRAVVADLVQQSLLITCLRPPLTTVDPPGHVLDQLGSVGAETLPAVAGTLAELRAIQAELHRHNNPDARCGHQSQRRAVVTRRMKTLSTAGRVPLAVDLRLDCEVHLPEHVAGEVERAASALARLTRQPTGEATWRDFYTAFCERYGTGTLVALRDVVHPDAGLGFPATYPGSSLPSPASGSGSQRDQTLLALAWQARADRSREIVLDEHTLDALVVGDPAAPLRVPPHVEVAARIHARSNTALQRGEFLITVAPARSAGTLTSRFTTLAPDSGLAKVYAGVPTAVDGALPAQMSFPPNYPHAENVSRVPRYLPHVLSLGEHRPPDTGALELDDLAITATNEGLHLVSLSRQQVVEPQVFHALALEKQTPPLARFLAHLARGCGASWHEFDWGPHAAHLAFLPRVRYRRAVLAPARWRLTTRDLPDGAFSEGWRQALDRWRTLWECPQTVELRDTDRSLRLDLDQPAHAALLHTHLRRTGHATLTETPDVGECGWIDGHAHEIVFPLVTTRPAAPAPAALSRPVLTREHGQLPGSADTSWLNAKIHTHAERLDEIITDHVPRLLATLDGPASWFIRYRSRTETDHLRLRLRTSTPQEYAAAVAAIGAWAQQLRDDRLVSRVLIDTYYPETGRYGHGPAMRAAEAVFVADSQVVVAQLRRLPDLHRDVLVAVNMVAIVRRFLGTIDRAMRWLIEQPGPGATPAARTVLGQVLRLTRDNSPDGPSGWPKEVTRAWRARADALAAYRSRLAPDMSIDTVLESLLHMHANRAIGVDRDHEATCRRLARHTALSWTAQERGNP